MVNASGEWLITHCDGVTAAPKPGPYPPVNRQGGLEQAVGSSLRLELPTMVLSQ
jgi:hypothetical protein